MSFYQDLRNSSESRRGYAIAMNDAASELSTLRAQLAAVTAERDALRAAMRKIADWNGCYGPYPEKNSDLWGPMAIVTAREAYTQNDAAIDAARSIT